MKARFFWGLLLSLALGNVCAKKMAPESAREVIRMDSTELTTNGMSESASVQPIPLIPSYPKGWIVFIPPYMFKEANRCSLNEAIKSFLAFGKETQELVLKIATEFPETMKTCNIGVTQAQQELMRRINDAIYSNASKWAPSMNTDTCNQYVLMLYKLFLSLINDFQTQHPEMYTAEHLQSVGALAIFLAGYDYVYKGTVKFLKTAYNIDESELKKP